MPIEVHCPNPACAKVHMVKNRYAGSRGKCPLCGCWMYVPKVGMMPSMIEARPEGLEEAARSWKQEAPAAAPRPVPSKLEPAPRRIEPAVEETIPVRPPTPAARRAAQPMAEEAAEVVAEEPVEKPKKRFSGKATLFLVLGMLALGVVAASPYLAEPSTQATGTFAERIGSLRVRGFDPLYLPFILAVPGVVGFVAFVALLVGIIARRYGFASIVLMYIATLLSAGMLFMGLTWFRDALVDKAGIDHSTQWLKEEGKATGEVHVSLGQQFHAGIGGAAAATLLFFFAALAMHQRWWTRILGFLFLGFVAALVPVWVFHKELGIPYELPRLI